MLRNNFIQQKLYNLYIRTYFRHKEVNMYTHRNTIFIYISTIHTYTRLFHAIQHLFILSFIHSFNHAFTTKDLNHTY
jgi:hypothetical protein